MLQLVYSPRSSVRLTEAEHAFVVESLATWPDAMNAPAVVDDGYDLVVRSSGNPCVRELIIGRAGLHEQMAEGRLATLDPREPGLRGLFHPTATPALSTLYQAIFYFDEVFLIHPGSPLLSGWHGYHRGHADDMYGRQLQEFVDRLTAFDRAVLPFKQAGMLRAVPPRMQRDPNFLTLITADLGDDEFRRTIADTWDVPAFVAAKKMEPLLPLVGADIGNPDEVRRELNMRARYSSRWNADDAEPGDLFRSDSYGVKEVHPTLAATILLNHAYLLADRHDLVPFTDDPRSQRLMQIKLKRVAELPGFADFRRELKLGSAALALCVLDEQVPRFRFRGAEDVLTARAKLADQLGTFREAIRAFAAEIDESPYDATFQQKVERVVAAKVRPALTELEREIRTSRDGFVARCVRNVRTGSVPILASIFVGLPASVIIGLSAGVVTVEAALETYLDIRAKKRHGLSLFLKP